MKKLIALAGAKGSGKDTAGAYLFDRYAAQQVAFADPIKDEINHIFNLNDENYNQYDLFKRSDISFTLPGHLSHTVPGRNVVREIGMLMRRYNVNQFTDYVEEAYNHYAGITVVTDLRFPNEMSMVRKNKGISIRIDRKGCDYDGHVTETGFSNLEVDYVIDNDGSVQDLYAKLDSIMKLISWR